MSISADTVKRLKICTVSIGFDSGPKTLPQIIGTGFMVNDHGVCMTNAHVASKLHIPIQYSNSNEPRRSPKARVFAYEVREKEIAIIKKKIKMDMIIDSVSGDSPGILGTAPPDIAVIATDFDKTPYLNFSDDLPAEGSDVYFCGFPLGTDMFFDEKGRLEQINSLLQKGIVSAWMPFYGIPDPHAFKIDATCNGGNSGSPVVDETGAVVGIVFAKHTEAFTTAVIIKDLYKPLLEKIEEFNESGEKKQNERFSLDLKKCFPDKNIKINLAEPEDKA